MNDSKNAENEPADEARDPVAQAPQQGAAESATELDPLQLENSELKDKLLRTLAEMENLRRRAEREVADAKTYGVTSFARDMLTFADNLRRAVESVPTERAGKGRGRVENLDRGD